MPRQLAQVQSGPSGFQTSERNPSEIVIGGSALVVITLITLNLISR